MTPEEKADNLVKIFYDSLVCDYTLTQAKWCATVCVEEILRMEIWEWPHNTPEGRLFWEKVKEEVLKN